MGLALKEIYEPDNKEDRRAPKEKPAASRRGFPKRDGDTTERRPSDGNAAEDRRPSDRNAAEDTRPSDGNPAETGTPRLRKKTARLESLERERF